MLGVLAGKDFSKGDKIDGTVLWGNVFPHQEYKAGTSCHARQLRDAVTGCTVVIDGSGFSLDDVLQSNRVGMLINSPSGRESNGRDFTANVAAPKTTGKPHCALRDIKAGEELLVGYGPQTRSLVGTADLVRWQKLQPTDV
jgi:hypothetical protein